MGQQHSWEPGWRAARRIRAAPITVLSTWAIHSLPPGLLEWCLELPSIHCLLPGKLTWGRTPKKSWFSLDLALYENGSSVISSPTMVSYFNVLQEGKWYGCFSVFFRETFPVRQISYGFKIFDDAASSPRSFWITFMIYLLSKYQTQLFPSVFAIFCSERFWKYYDSSST